MNKEIKKDLELRRLEAKDLTQFNDILRYAFQVTDEQLLKVGWKHDEIKRSKFPILEKAEVIGWFEDGRLAAQIAVYPLQVNISGSIYQMGYITGVATYPEYMGLGLMSGLMKKSLETMYERKQCISFLFPYSHPLYRYKGWEVVSDKMTFHIRDHQLPRDIDVPGRVKRVKENSPDLIALHDTFARQTHGCLIRNQLVWEEYWRWDVEDVTVAIYYGTDDRPLGYLVYLIENDIFRVKEMIYLNQEARKGLWGYIAAHESMINEVVGSNYNNHTVSFLFGDSDMKETIRPYIMARIVDFEGFIGQYHFANTDLNETITFDIVDPVLDWNNRSFTISFAKGKAPVLVDLPSENRIKLEIGILTCMLLGYKRPTYLQQIERIEASKKTVTLLETIIANEKVYFSDYI
ncbi:GNAT family N-acetyltransferase [uncultured Acetobacterium sp.]|jgi:predicted acetyltransferase|uniref:GNAT family N-acetyltransferase n=1 Tax=uncultured Acetobacterium sp. TaxID=217139 RepID=UPI0024219B88|nr:GNAT family N-acetyltransferase [uncultured Acetobacterium sp.]MBU4541473.1 GNAT family N-acetyltransferase [Bacillota bacterium]